MRRRTSLLVGLMALVGFAGVAPAATINVPTQQPTIQNAINAASNGDTILVAPGGSYAGDFTITRGVTIRSTGGAAVTTIRNTTSAGITVAANAVTLDGFTIISATWGRCAVTIAGDAVESNTVSIQNSILKGNETTAGIYVDPNIEGGHLVIQNNTFTKDASAGFFNAVQFAAESYGAPINGNVAAHTATIDILGNQGTDVMYTAVLFEGIVYNSTINVRNNTFAGVDANGNNGLEVRGSIATQSAFNVADNTFTDFGAGVAVDGVTDHSSLSITGCRMTNFLYTGISVGDGVTDNSSLLVDHCTLTAGTTSGPNQGVACGLISGGSTSTITNSYFQGVTTGVWVDRILDTASLVAHQNNFAGATTGIVNQNGDAAHTVNAENNYFGAATPSTGNVDTDPALSGPPGGAGGGGGGGLPDLSKDQDTTDANGAATLTVSLDNTNATITIAGARAGVPVSAELSNDAGHGFAGIGAGNGSGAMPQRVTASGDLGTGTPKATIEICYGAADLAAAGLTAADLAIHTWDAAQNKWVLAGTNNLGNAAPTGSVGDFGWHDNCIWVVVNHFSEFIGADACPNDPAKNSPGICGCGSPDVDSDQDGVLDCQDGCPNDPTTVCGCGVPDTDSDADGTPDCKDKCPGGDDRIDADGDGTPDACDNCPNASNADQADSDGDGTGDACDSPVAPPAEPETPSAPAGFCGLGVADMALLSAVALMAAPRRRRRW